jgi:hypothetical protein
MNRYFRIVLLLAIFASAFFAPTVPSVSAQADSEDQPLEFYCHEVPCFIFSSHDVAELETYATRNEDEKKTIKYDEYWTVNSLYMRPVHNIVDGEGIGWKEFIPENVSFYNGRNMSLPEMGIQASPYDLTYNTINDYGEVTTGNIWLSSYSSNYAPLSEIGAEAEDDLKISFSWDGVRLMVWRWYPVMDQYETVIHITDFYFAHRKVEGYNTGNAENWQDLVKEIPWPEFNRNVQSYPDCTLGWATGIQLKSGSQTILGQNSKEFWYGLYGRGCTEHSYVTQLDQNNQILKTQPLQNNEGYISLEVNGQLAYRTVIELGTDHYTFLLREATSLSGQCSGEFWYKDEGYGWNHDIQPQNILSKDQTSINVELSNCTEAINFEGYLDGRKVSTFSSYYQYPWTIDFADAEIDAAHLTSGTWSAWFLLDPTTQLEKVVEPKTVESEQVQNECQVWYTSQNGSDGFMFADYYHYVPRDFIVKWTNCQQISIKADSETVPVEESTNSQIVLHFEDSLTGHLINKFEVYSVDGKIATFYSSEHDNFFVAFLRKWGPQIRGLNWDWKVEAILMLLLILLSLLGALFVLYTVVNLIIYEARKLLRLMREMKNAKGQLTKLQREHEKTLTELNQLKEEKDEHITIISTCGSGMPHTLYLPYTYSWFKVDNYLMEVFDTMGGEGSWCDFFNRITSVKVNKEEIRTYDWKKAQGELRSLEPGSIIEVNYAP